MLPDPVAEPVNQPLPRTLGAAADVLAGADGIGSAGAASTSRRSAAETLASSVWLASSPSRRPCVGRRRAAPGATHERAGLRRPVWDRHPVHPGADVCELAQRRRPTTSSGF